MAIKILLTGGHAGSTAYSLIQEIRMNQPEWEIIFVGSPSAVEGKKQLTIENNYFPKIGIRYIPVISGRIQRKFTIWTIPSLLRIPVGFFHAFGILYKERPDVVVSFGGYAAYPVVVISKLFRVPVIVHEQTAAAGRTNIASSVFADKIAVSRKESIRYFPKDKCQLTGNPISKEVIKCPSKKVSKRRISILITGGSRGSVAINEVVKKILPKLIKNFTVYHQTGSSNFREFDSLRKMFELNKRSKYLPFPTVEMWKWYEYLTLSDIIVSRSGANIVSEIVYLSIPSVLIPLPHSYKNEQYENALYVKKLGLARIIDQKDLSAAKLYQEIMYLSDNWENIVRSSKKPPIDDSKAAENLYRIILQYVKNT